jgi:hypothetical protein
MLKHVVVFFEIRQLLSQSTYSNEVVSRTALLLESRLSLSAVSVQSHWILI